MSTDAYLGTGLGALRTSAPTTPGQVATAYLLQTLRRSPPGYPTDNRLEQSRHYTGSIYLCVQVYLDAMSSATATVMRRRRKKSEGDGDLVAKAFRKAMPTPHAQSRDEDWAPARPDHPLAKLLETPNCNEELTDVLRQTLIQYFLTGSAPLWANPNAAGVPVELWVLPTALLFPLPGSADQFPGGAYRLNWYWSGAGGGVLPGSAGAGAVIDARQVIRLRNEHPLYPWDATSPLTAAGRQIDILETIDEARWATFDHGVTLDTIFMMPGLGDEGVKGVGEQLKAQHAGAKNHRRALVLSEPGAGAAGAKWSVTQNNANVREMDFNQSHEQAMEFVLALFGVPKTLAGLESVGSYAQAYAQRQQFRTNKLLPLAHRLGSLLTRGLARAWGPDYRVQIDIPDVDDKDISEKQLNTDLQYGGVTQNQYLALRGRPPVGPDGDVPAPIYLAKLQQSIQPPEQTAGGQEQPPGDPGQAPPDDAGDPSGGLESSVLAALGIQGGDEPGMVQPGGAAPFSKARKPFGVSQPNGIYTDKRGRKYRLQDGKRVRVSNVEPQSRRSGRAAIAPEGRAGAAPQAPAGDPTHAAILKHPTAKGLGLSADILAKTHPDFVRQLAAGMGIQAPAGRPAANAPAAPHDIAAAVPLPPAEKPAVDAAVKAARPKLQAAVQKLRAAQTPDALPDEDLPDADPPASGGKPPARNPAAAMVSGAQAFQRWGLQSAVKHAPHVSKQTGMSVPAAAHFLHRAFKLVCAALAAPAKGAAAGLRALDDLDSRATDALNRGVGRVAGDRGRRVLLGDDGGPPAKSGGPTAGGPPRPKNKGGKGSLPPRKAFDPAAEYADPAPYGYCPECREPFTRTFRHRGAPVFCDNGHEYPRNKAKYASTQIELTGAARSKLLALAAAIPDADLGDDGRETEPHVTARYGLHTDSPATVAALVEGFGPVSVRLGRLAAFRGAESGKPYDVIHAEVDSPDLHRLHALLGALPHTDTWPDYHPHATVAYVRAGLAAQYLAAFGAIDETAEVTRLTFSTAAREQTVLPLGASRQKAADAMSTLSGSGGGFLVPDGTAPRKRKRKGLAGYLARRLKALGKGV